MLSHNELVVNAAVFQKLGVGSELGDLSVVKDKQSVRVAEGGKPVGDRKGCAVSDQLFQRVLYQLFRFGVKSRRCLVKDEYLRVVDYCAGNGYPLFSPPERE